MGIYLPTANSSHSIDLFTSDKIGCNAKAPKNYQVEIPDRYREKMSYKFTSVYKTLLRTV